MKFLFLAIAALAFLYPASAQAGHTYYVAPNGDDTWSGTLPDANGDASDGPFASLHKAVDTARDVRASGHITQPVKIFLRGGTHFLGKPLTLTPADSGTAESPLTIAAYPGEAPILSGGLPITGWRQTDGPLWAADLPEVPGVTWDFRSLRVGGDSAIQARHPNFDPELPRKGGWLFARQTTALQDGGLFGVEVSNLHTVGNRLEWDVPFPESGDYTVWVRYGHKMKAYNRENMDNQTVIGIVDGPEAPMVDLPDTDGWFSARWGKAAMLSVAEGTQRVYWENKKGGGIQLDAFVFSNDPTWHPKDAIAIDATGEYTLTPPNAGHALVIQAESCVAKHGAEIKVGEAKPKGLKDRLIMDNSDFPDWDSWEGADLHIFPAWGWVNTIIPIKGADATKATLFVDSPQEIRPGNRFYVAGTRAALDSPGEWYLDRENKQVLYWPPSGPMSDVDVVAPVMDRLISFEGTDDSYVEHVHIEGLTFMDSTYTLGHTYSPADGALRFTRARHCEITANTFTLLGGYGAHLTGQSHDIAITRNTLTKIGQGGVIMTGNKATQAYDNLIAANTMEDLGQIYKHVAGALITTGSGNRIAHNRIQRVPRYGVSLKSFSEDNYSHNNIVEYNAIIDTNLETNDTGAIETLGRDRKDSGNIIRYNLIRNVVGLKCSPEGEIMSPHFTWGIYLDDYSSGTDVIGNMVDGTVIGGFCIHGGKNNRIENNIFLNASEQQLRLQPRDDFMAGNTFKHNIVGYQDPETTLWYSYDQTWRPDRLSECDHNLYWCYGDPALATGDRSITPEGTWAQWLETGHDRHSVWADPQFSTLADKAYTLAPESKAYALGFKPIPHEKIGPRGYEPDSP